MAVPDSKMSHAEAACILGVSEDADESQARVAFKSAAKRVHPDKTGEDSTAEFVELQRALEVFVANVQSNVVPIPCSPTTDGLLESERLDRHFFGTAFGSDEFDPRAWAGEASAAMLAGSQPVPSVWRCRQCPVDSSVCCRLKGKKHSCICGHKVEAHAQQKHFKCTAAGCSCPKLQFHVQQLGWEVKCRCKHHVRDHTASKKPPWKCTKRIPGKDQKPCPCEGFDASWVCTCGHGWAMHETVSSVLVSKAIFAREWVAHGIRPECVAEAEEKRNKWAADAARLASRVGVAAASKQVAQKAQNRGISMCAEAKMQEAVRGTRNVRSPVDRKSAPLSVEDENCQ